MAELHDCDMSHVQRVLCTHTHTHTQFNARVPAELRLASKFLPFLKRFTLCYRSIVCPVLSVTFMYCGQTVGSSKIKLGTEVDLGPGHIVLVGRPIFGPCLLWPSGHPSEPISATES